MLEVEGFRRSFPNPGFTQSHQIIYPGTSEAPLHPVSHHPFFPSNQGQPWLQEREAEKRTQSPDTGSQSGDEDEDDEYRPFTPPPPRERLSYTRYQLELLNGIYNHVRYPNSTQKQLIAKRVGITREQVKIWFQNRRRKDVVSKQDDKPKSDDASPESKSEISDDKSNHSDKTENGDSDSGVSDTGSGTDEQEKSMVPTIVLKGVIAELHKFEKDALKPKKKAKKKTKAMKKKELKSNLANALLHGGFDVVNPPNQIVPTATGQRLINKFSHCSKSSAFESPRDSSKTATPNFFDYSSMGSAAMLRSPTRAYMSNTLGLPTSALGCDLPVLSDLLTASSEQRKEHNESRNIPCRNSQIPTERDRRGEITSHPHFPSPYSNPFGYIYPYHFLAEPGIMLSSLRHSEPYRHYGHYPPIFCSEPSSFHQISPAHLSNPYYSSMAPPPSSLPWNSHNMSTSSSSDSSYEQL